MVKLYLVSFLYNFLSNLTSRPFTICTSIPKGIRIQPTAQPFLHNCLIVSSLDWLPTSEQIRTISVKISNLNWFAHWSMLTQSNFTNLQGVYLINVLKYKHIFQKKCLPELCNKHDIMKRNCKVKKKRSEDNIYTVTFVNTTFVKRQINLN